MSLKSNSDIGADESEIRRLLSSLPEPETGVLLMTLGLVEEIRRQADEVSITFHPISPYTPLTLVVKLAVDIQKAVRALPGLRRVHVRVTRHPLGDYVNASLERYA